MNHSIPVLSSFNYLPLCHHLLAESTLQRSMVPLKYFAEYVYTSRKTLKINIQYIRTYEHMNKKRQKSVKKTTQQKSLTSTNAALAVFCLWIAKLQDFKLKTSLVMIRLEYTLSKKTSFTPSFRIRHKCR